MFSPVLWAYSGCQWKLTLIEKSYSLYSPGWEWAHLCSAFLFSVHISSHIRGTLAYSISSYFTPESKSWRESTYSADKIYSAFLKGLPPPTVLGSESSLFFFTHSMLSSHQLSEDRISFVFASRLCFITNNTLYSRICATFLSHMLIGAKKGRMTFCFANRKVDYLPCRILHIPGWHRVSKRSLRIVCSILWFLCPTSFIDPAKIEK